MAQTDNPRKKRGRFMPSVIRITAQGKVKAAARPDVMNPADLTDLDTMIPLIQALIPSSGSA